MNWQTPQELPDLRRVGIVALDTETNDEGLRADRGSAWPWRDGHVCGISVAWRADGDIARDLHSAAPSRQRQFRSRPGLSLARGPGRIRRRASPLMNGVYDFGLAARRGGIAMPPSDRLEEVGALATTVNENLFRYSLDALCETYGLPGKDEILLREAVEAAGFATRRKKVNARAHLAAAGEVCRPVRRGRCGQHALAV